MMLSSRSILRLGPVLALALGACQGLEDFARSVDEAAATIIPGEATSRESEAERSYRLGLKQLNGDGVARNERAALELLEKAAALGHAEAQYLTAQSYALGRGTAIDHAWAARWYGKAAEQGHAKAQYWLGKAYASAQGLPRDRVAAYAWLTLAAAQKDADPEAIRERDALARKMSRSDIDQAERLASRWQPATTNEFADPPTVRFVQFALADLGFPPGPIDGQLGQRTRRALLKYQAKAGLTGDGALTPLLLDKLRSDRLPVSSVAKTGR